MTSISNHQSGEAVQSWPAKMLPYAQDPVAAAGAVFVCFYGFMAKSARQLGAPMPKLNFEVLKAGFKAAPTIGLIVGTQMAAQKVAENILMGISSSNTPTFATIMASSLFVGAVSVPALAVFNGQTLGRTVLDSLKTLSAKQAMAIVSRETSFLFSLRISNPLGESMKTYFGDNKSVEYSSAFASGAIGSVIGHPADTALTIWQKNMKIESARQLMRGASIKAATVGSFSICYKLAKDTFNKVAGYKE